MTAKVKKRSRWSADDRGERILVEATKLFARKGFAKTSVQDIADRCRISQTAVLYHFRTKDEIAKKVLERIVAHNHGVVEEALAGVADPAEQLRQHLLANLRWAVENPAEAQIILLLYYLASFDASFSRRYLQILGAARARLVQYLAKIPRGDCAATPEDISAWAELFHDALLGGIVNILATRIAEESSAGVTAAAQKWERLVAAWSTPAR